MMMADSSNTELWDKIERTDPAHVKTITGKPYRGNSPKPYYLVRKATETFGPCGRGWGYKIDSLGVVDGLDGDKLSVAQVTFWYVQDKVRGEVSHVGATPLCGHRKNGEVFIDEDASKKSVTDALTKAMSMVGFAGDIFMGRYDDSKYVEEIAQEFDQDRGSKEQERLVQGALDAFLDATSADSLAKLWKARVVANKADFTKESIERLREACALRGNALRDKEQKEGRHE